MPGNLSPEQRHVLGTTFHCLESTTIYSRSVIPVVSETDERLLRALVDLAESCVRNLALFFPELREVADERVTPKDESPIERELRRLEYIRGRMIECSEQSEVRFFDSKDSAPMLRGRVKSWADELGKVAEAIRGWAMRKPAPPTAPPIKFLLECSDGLLGNFELAKLSEVANMRREMLALFDRLVDVSAQACLAHWLRTIDRNELRRRLLESPDATINRVIAEAKEDVRNSGRSQEEAEDYGKMPSPRLLGGPPLTPEERRKRHNRASMDWAKQNIANGKCERCTEALDRNSVRCCTKHLAMKRQQDRKDREKKGVLIGMHGRHPNTLKAFRESSEKRKRMKPLSLHMPDKAHAMTQAELLKNTDVSKTTVRKALRQLLDAGRIQRIGPGSLREPYRYFAK